MAHEPRHTVNILPFTLRASAGQARKKADYDKTHSICSTDYYAIISKLRL
jgi:hypothetical protein